MSAVTVSQSNQSELIVARSEEIEKLRIQLLWGAIVRIELSRPDGSFCDLATFTVLAREPEGRLEAAADRGGEVIATTKGVNVRVSPRMPSVRELFASLSLEREGVTLWSVRGDAGLFSNPPRPASLPRPCEAGPLWALPDRPRAVPPDWGSLPPPEGFSGEDSGWRFEPEALDIYLFLYDGDVHKLYRLVTLLTGRIPLPPLWTFGFWHSRYYPYTERTVRETIDRYEAEEFPIDVFVIDTDWRVGGSQGYEIDTNHFPDMARVLKGCRQRGVRTLFNDHPEPLDFAPLDPGLFRYRRDNLNRMLDMGLTTWWFDRNWRQIMPGPVPGVETAVWGQKLYWDILSNRAPDRRTVLLSMSADHFASHRYPIWWTGDIESDWRALGQAVRDSVDAGLQLRPFTGQDIGGHVGYPSPEQYVRWMQWGAISPTFRVHSGPRNRFRYPWRFGQAALQISRDYARLRYRMLPLFYTLAREAHDTGVPMHRSMEFFDPRPPLWTRESQFLLGEDLIVAPVIEPLEQVGELRSPIRFERPLHRRVWLKPRWSEEIRRGGELPIGPEDETGYDHEIRIDALNWSERRMAWKQGFHVVWDGSFEVREDGWYIFRLEGNGMKSLVVDEDFPAQLMGQFDTGDREVALPLDADTKHRIRVTYQDDGLVNPAVQLGIAKAAAVEELPAGKKRIWIPSGSWRDLWSGKTHKGPATVEVPVSLHKLPVLARAGAIVPLGPIPRHTGRAAWDPLTWEVFVPEDEQPRRFLLYEDDGESTSYLNGQWARTSITVQKSDGMVSIRFGKPEGEYAPSITRTRCFVRVHLPPGTVVTAVRVGEKEILESSSVPAKDSGGPWWQRLPVSETLRRAVPLSLSELDPGQPGSESILVSAAAKTLAIQVHIEDA
jgi:hypothetical protein